MLHANSVTHTHIPRQRQNLFATTDFVTWIFLLHFFLFDEPHLPASSEVLTFQHLLLPGKPQDTQSAAIDQKEKQGQ